MISTGFSISFGLDELADCQDHKNDGNPKPRVEVPVQEIREPLIDILEEAGFTMILAELPGITRQDIKLSLKEDLLTISASRDQRRYYKEVLLPGPHARQRLKFSCNNGILEIRAFK
ncbi:MAG: Hsp20/alpha crystallin family protein [Syntrophobacterales bacterium]|jgi:HSP20 family protein|nr:Hsp20/alpha crystallin family protein [Syntrophobacterales bacterium]